MCVVAPMFKSNTWRNLRRHGNVADIREKCIATSVTTTVSVIVNVGLAALSAVVLCWRSTRRTMMGIVAL